MDAVQPIAISVVIPTYQRYECVERLLQAFNRQTLSPDRFEVIVVIDGSQDSTFQVVTGIETPYMLHCIWQTNKGVASARNTGIHQAVGELIVLLDDDMEPAPHFLEGHLKAHPPGSRLGVVGAAPIQYGPSSPPLVAFIGSGFNSRLEKFAQPGYAIPFKEAYTGNFSIRREILLGAGGFDADFKVYGYEDYELALRLVRNGVKIIFSAEALAHQHYEKDTTSFLYNSISRGRSAVLMLSKHPEIFQDLKLSTYQQTSLRWRMLRSALLTASRIWPGITCLVIKLIRFLEQHHPKRMAYFYTLAVDYCFWLGAQSALSENRAAGKEPAMLKGWTGS
jgi:GT2 family glycosyltransferase